VTRWLRGSAVATGTIAMTALAMVYPLYARGEAWIGAKWVLWYALFAIVAVPAVIYKMTLGTDGREPRLTLPTIAPLLTGPRGLRSRLRDVPGMLRGASRVRRTSSGERTPTSAASTSSSSSTSPARCAR
jgi:Ca-activated chloride channel family protein